MRAAAVQLNAGADRARNIERAERLVRVAAAEGAELVVLPEKWDLLADGALLAERAAPLTGEAVSAARGWARELGLVLLAGSVSERLGEGERPANTSLVIDREGEIVARYRKIHMFDVDIDGIAYRESEELLAGSEIVLADPGLELELGLTICYDLRFPELFRILALRGAGIITVPSAFTAVTGEPHWEPLIRARAIENQLFVVAANQQGAADPHFNSWGHSMIVDAWGRVLACCDSGEGLALADLEPAELERVRRELPSLANRRAATYLWPAVETTIGAHGHG